MLLRRYLIIPLLWYLALMEIEIQQVYDCARSCFDVLCCEPIGVMILALKRRAKHAGES